MAEPQHSGDESQPLRLLAILTSLAAGSHRWWSPFGYMRYMPSILIPACIAAALCQWFVLLMIFLQLETMVQKVGFGPGMVSVGDSGLFAFFGGSGALISLCLVSRRGLSLASDWRALVTVVMWVLIGGAALLALALCTPYFAIAHR